MKAFLVRKLLSSFLGYFIYWFTLLKLVFLFFFMTIFFVFQQKGGGGRGGVASMCFLRVKLNNIFSFRGKFPLIFNKYF
jgi:hypothetical protein